MLNAPAGGLTKSGLPLVRGYVCDGSRAKRAGMMSGLMSTRQKARRATKTVVVSQASDVVRNRDRFGGCKRRLLRKKEGSPQRTQRGKSKLSFNMTGLTNYTGPSRRRDLKRLKRDPSRPTLSENSDPRPSQGRSCLALTDCPSRLPLHAAEPAFHESKSPTRAQPR